MRLIFVNLFVLCVINEISCILDIVKCCPVGKEMIQYKSAGKFGFDCMPIDRKANESIEEDESKRMYSYRGIQSNGIHIPECDEYNFEELDQKTLSLPTRYCIDWYNDKLLAIYCKDSPFEVIKISKYHKCCPKGLVYSNVEHMCVDPQNTTQLMAFEKLIKNDFSIFTIGPPICETNREVMIVYKSHVHKMELDDLKVKVNGQFISNLKYCTEITDEGNWIVQACVNKDICGEIPCVQKCCKFGEAVFKKPGVASYCDTFLGGVKSEFYDLSDFKRNEQPPQIIYEEFGIISGLDCPRSIPGDNIQLYLSHENGHLFVVEDDRESFYNYKDYCMDLLVWNEQSTIRTFLCLKEPAVKFKIFAIALIISCVALFITIIVYVCIPKLCNLHGKTLLGNVISSFLAYSCLAYVQMDSSALSEHCRVLSYIIYFGFISSFSWLNIMCFDIYLKIRSIAPKPGTSIKSKDLRRFVYYSLYGIGFPVLLTTITYLIDEYELVKYKFLPRMGYTTCWFQEQHSRPGSLIYFLSPISVQIIINLVLFILTAIYCNRVRNEISKRKDRDNDDKLEKKKKSYFKDKAKIKLLVKLFIVMGISWSLEIFSTIFHDFEYVFYMIDFFNSVHGICIFVIFVCKKNIYESVKEKFCCIPSATTKRRSEATMTTTMTSRSSGMSGVSDPYSKIKRSESQSPRLSKH